MSAAQVVGPNGTPLPLSSSVKQRAKATSALTRIAYGRTAYDGAGRNHSALREWSPLYVSGQHAASMDREALAARAHDLVRNDGWINAAVEKKLMSVVADGLRLRATPNWRSLGITREEAQAVADQIEALWRDYTQEPGFWCDAQRSGNAASMLASAAYHAFVDHEAFGLLVWRETSPTGFQTALQIVHPHRCCNPQNTMDTDTLQDGVEIDDLGAAAAYHFRDAHPGDVVWGRRNPFTWTRIERETDWGRPRVIHVRQRREAEMTRAVTSLASFMRKAKQMSNYDDYELNAAALNALMAAFIKTPHNPEALLDAMDSDHAGQDLAKLYNAQMEAQGASYKDHPLVLGDAAINILNTGEEVELTRPEHPNAGFEAFYKFGLRNLATVMGLTTEQLTMDWSETNYAGARSAFAEAWRGFMHWRKKLADEFMSPWYSAVLEEMFDKGLLDLPDGAPGFADAREAWCHAAWIGSARGYVDPAKEVAASRDRIAAGLSTLQKEAAEQGDDWGEIAEQRAHERSVYSEYGIDPDIGRPEARIQTAVQEAPAEDDDDVSGAAQARQRRARRTASGVPAIRRAV